MKIMKMRSLFLTGLCCLLTVVGFTSCNNDDDNNAWREGAKVQLSPYRAFILSEGSMNKNNSHLFYVDPTQDTIYTQDIYEAQNGRKIGDTAQGLVAADGDLYFVCNVSNYVARLNGSAVEQARYAFDKKLGQPRFLVVDDGKVFVTTYGGYVCQLDARSLALQDSVKVGTTLERIVEWNNKLYVVQSGMKSNALYVLNEHNLKQYETVAIMNNPTGIYEDNGYFWITAYDEAYTSYVSSYNPQTKQWKKIANATVVVPVGETLYIANSETNWTTYKTTTTFSRYNAVTENLHRFLKGYPEEVGSQTVYMLARNPYDDTFYMATTDYVSNGKVYHFAADGNYIGKTFSAGGINPNSMVFIKQ